MKAGDRVRLNFECFGTFETGVIVSRNGSFVEVQLDHETDTIIVQDWELELED